MDTTGIELKHCWCCDKWFPATAEYYHRDKSKHDGLHGSCKGCTRKRKRKWQKGNPEKMAEHTKRYRLSKPPRPPRINKTAENVKYKWGIKSVGCCLHCGEQRPEVLNFHHREPKDKLFSLHDSGSRDLEDVKAEIAKCDLLCANCHTVLHYWENHK